MTLRTLSFFVFVHCLIVLHLQSSMKTVYHVSINYCCCRNRDTPLVNVFCHFHFSFFLSYFIILKKKSARVDRRGHFPGGTEKNKSVPLTFFIKYDIRQKSTFYEARKHSYWSMNYRQHVKFLMSTWNTVIRVKSTDVARPSKCDGKYRLRERMRWFV